MASNFNKFEGGKSEEKLGRMRAEAEIANSRQDNTSRKNIAYWFSTGFVLISFIIIIGTPIYNATIGKNAPLDSARMIESFGSLFGSPLGFVLGYYFKDKNN